jgi:2-methylisocitrate lyase-like PEP mutase family enzyme
MPRPSVADKRRTFRKLHESGCWMIPNPWDVGSARYLQGLGFKALATTSSGFAWSVAHADNAVARDMMLAHIAEIVAATDVPVNADFEGGYADEPAGVAESVRLCCATGVAGLSIEDSTGNKDKPLYDIPFAVERMKAARAAIDTAAPDVMLTGRAEGFHLGRARSRTDDRAAASLCGGWRGRALRAGIKTREQIEAVVRAVAPKPVNFLNGAAFGHSVSDLAAMGVRRISVGGALARSAWGGFIRMAKEIAEQGTFAGFKDAASGAS